MRRSRSNNSWSSGSSDAQVLSGWTEWTETRDTYLMSFHTRKRASTERGEWTQRRSRGWRVHSSATKSRPRKWIWSDIKADDDQPPRLVCGGKRRGNRSIARRREVHHASRQRVRVSMFLSRRLQSIMSVMAAAQCMWLSSSPRLVSLVYKTGSPSAV